MIISKQVLVFWVYTLWFIKVLFSRLSIGNIHLSKINLPTKELISYLVNPGDFWEIRILIILQMQRNG